MRIHNCNRDTVKPQAGLRTKAPMRQHIRNPLVYTVPATFPRIHVKGEKGRKNQEPKNSCLGLPLFIFFSLQENDKEVVDKKQPEPASPPRVSMSMKIQRNTYAQPLLLLGRRDETYYRMVGGVSV